MIPSGPRGMLRRVVVGFTTALAACGPAVDPEYLRYAEMVYSGPDGDVLGVGDRFALRVFGDEALSGEFGVDESRTIALPLIGAVEVGGRRCSEIAAELTRRLADGYLRDPAVSCEIIERNSQRVVVSGEVRSPGRFTYSPSLTVVEALALAEGLTADAAEDRVVVTRIVDGRSVEVVVPLKQILSGRTPNFLLWPGDIVTVPAFRLLP
jgi:protein involved in polysaccharide export with SLBB domain